ncbi:phosphotransferase-like protein [Streptomyces sp. HF10]|uniref:phosphotransferase-like protein n=1 Tax=Streptomyces sp. HF10 TaxID=2692233 RepID=UPI002E2C7F9E|nr:hypothetical protein [Streptomyces sp. HF10]
MVKSRARAPPSAARWTFVLSIARELLEMLTEPSFHLPVDAIHAMRTRRGADPQELPAILRRTWMGFHRAVAGMAAVGNHVVVDHVLSHDEPPGLRPPDQRLPAPTPNPGGVRTTPRATAPRPDGPRSRGRDAALTRPGLPPQRMRGPAPRMPPPSCKSTHMLPGPLVGICGAVGM